MAKKILVVDDDLDTQELVTYRLKASGYKVISAPDGKTGLRRMKEDKPDLVILDVRMPQMDGFECCRIARSDPELKGLPIIFLSTAAQAWDLKKGKQVGADGYVIKPYDSQGLVEEIKKYLPE
ncbi:PleD family two-component system response regulator [Candidatus Omnitrophota bacterium]